MDLVLTWFIEHNITIINVIILGIILKNINYVPENENNIDVYCGYIFNTLLYNGMIKDNEHYVLNMKYVKVKNMGIVDNLVEIMEEISDNPNIINEGRWVAASKSDKKENTCIPCKSKHYFLYPFTI
jgi:hypothetical protein